MSSKPTIKTKEFRKVLKYWGLTLKRIKGGHKSWAKTGMLRPVIIQTHKKRITRIHL